MIKLLKNILFYIRYGFKRSELWDLYIPLAKFILPRLEAFKKFNSSGVPYGLTKKKWNDILDNMIFSFNWIVKGDKEFDMDVVGGLKQYKKNSEKCQKGLTLFGEHFQSLWD